MGLEDGSSDRAWLTDYFESLERTLEALDKLAAAMPAYWFVNQPLVRELPCEDWKVSYKAHFKAWKFSRFNWVPVWQRESFALPVGKDVLWLDPSMAFGTGKHETTRQVTGGK